MNSRNNDDLYEAVLRGDLGAIGRLLRSGRVDINALSVSGLSALGAACHIGDYNACETLINNETINETIDNPNKKICLDRKNIGYFIVRKDLDQDDNNFEDFTPEGMENLEWDTEITNEDQNNSYDESYSCLYKYYADILNQTADALSNNQTSQPQLDLNLLDRYGRTALHYASQSGNVKIVELLIKKGANINECGKFDGMSSLHLASRLHHPDVSMVLIDSGARIDCQDVNGRTPLHYAAYEGNAKCVKLLLWRGANVNSLDNCDRTPLSLACVNNKPEVVQLLLNSKRCRINMADIEGRTALTEAVSSACVDSVRLLISYGAKVNNCHSQKLLHMAVLNMNEEMVKILCANGMQCNSRDDNGNTPLHLAVRADSDQIFNILVQHGANVNALNTVTGASILHNMVEFQPDSNHQLFENILEKIYKKNKIKIDLTLNGESALRIAICQNKSQIANILLRFGANLIINNNYDSILHPDLISLIESKNLISVAKLVVYSGLYDLNRREDIVCMRGVDVGELNVKRWFSLAKYEPMSLMHICKILIRKKLGQGNVHFVLGQLGLPKILNDFLDMKTCE